MVIGPGQEKTAATARSFVIGGEELSKKGRYAAAEKLYQRALGLVERTLGQQHPITAEVLECYADLLVKTNRPAEGIAMKTRSEAIWKTYAPHYSWRTHIQVRPAPTYWAEREGSD
jgi:Tetratricopeptide repeat